MWEWEWQRKWWVDEGVGGSLGMHYGCDTTGWDMWREQLYYIDKLLDV